MEIRIREVIGSAILATVLLVAALALSGCSVLDRAAGASGAGGLLSVESTAPRVEPPPEPAADHLELRSAAADFGARVLARVHTTGAEPGAPLAAVAPLVEQAVRAADAVSGDVGKPAKPWPLDRRPEAGPSFAEATEGGGRLSTGAAPSVEAGLIDYAAAVARDRKDRRAWERDVTEQARAPARSSWRIGSPALGVYLLFGVGGVGAVLVAAGRWAWRWRKTALQLIPGIGTFLTVADAHGGGATGRDLKIALTASTDADVKMLIDQVKRKAGL